MGSLLMSASHMPKCLNGVPCSKKDEKKIKNETHKRCSQTSVTTENINRDKKLILEDQRVNMPDISDTLGISIGSVEEILHNRLRYRKISTR